MICHGIQVQDRKMGIPQLFEIKEQAAADKIV
jgi:hypothetical protein